MRTYNKVKESFGFAYNISSNWNIGLFIKIPKNLFAAANRKNIVNQCPWKWWQNGAKMWESYLLIPHSHYRLIAHGNPRLVKRPCPWITAMWPSFVALSFYSYWRLKSVSNHWTSTCSVNNSGEMGRAGGTSTAEKNLSVGSTACSM